MSIPARLCASTALVSTLLLLPAQILPVQAQQVAANNVETVIVTASPIAQAADQFSTIVDVVQRDQILDQGGSNLADSLKTVPGVAGTGFAAGASRPVIRGMDATRVMVLEDGLSSSDVSDIGPDHGVPIDPMITQRLEVVRGAATLRYGSAAIGGVVNAINNRVPLTLPDAFHAEGNIAYDSVSDGAEGGLMADGAAGDFAFHGDVFLRRQSDYDTPLGMQGNSFSHGDGFSGGTSYFFGDNRVGAAVVHYDADYGIPSDTTHIVMRQTKFLTDDSFAVGAGPLKTVNLQASYAIYGHTEDEPDGSIDSTFLNKEFDGRAETVFGAIGPFSNSAAGIQVKNRRYSALGEDSDYLFPTQTQSEAGYLFTELPFASDLNLQLAGRAELVHISGTPASDTFTQRDFAPFSASAGLLWDATDTLKLGLTFTSAGRAPAQTELFARGGHDGPETFETGDPSLRMERSNSLEASLRTDLAGIHFEGSLWGAKFSNYIYGNLTGRYCSDDGDCVPAALADDDHDLKELNYAQRDADFWGLEAKASRPVWDGGSGTLSLNMLADYVRATFGQGFGNVPRIQPYRIGGGIDWNSAQFDASMLILGVGAQHQTGAFETPTDGYIDVGAQAAWRPFADTGFEIGLVAHNLTDAEERNAVALNKDDVMMPGRNIRIFLRQSF